MKNNIFVENYTSCLSLKETEVAIKLVKDTFENLLAIKLNLTRVSAPIFVNPHTGLNDNLNGYEKAVNFIVQENKKELEVVQSLAKWKRNALKKYGFTVDSGIYTDMNAIRPFEDLDNLHSLYVDQWDWERVISLEERNESFLKRIVKDIYEVLKDTERKAHITYPVLGKTSLPEDITFISSEELEELYPSLTPKERENIYCKEHGAVFLMHIGGKLKDGNPHDGRAADYDDWSLNGDILLWYEPLKIAYEVSSMGIRVNKESLLSQIKEKGEEYKLDLPYHQDILNERLPLTIGGGIGQSRMCMFMLKKVHIGEVQASYWTEEDIDAFAQIGVHLL
ncbi:MAG: aspartate--ammonia ligase [Bacilli bacterium]